ncbi:MAG: hypothetical protein MI741_10020, partial [Rhodospirillales bacterium]|nr:hypothetical protein [Rhodospirillales bacterium]
LFLVKVIGDEFWWVYESKDDSQDHLATIATAFFSTILDLFAAERYLTLALAAGNDSDIPIRQFNLPLKAFMDHIDEATELSAARYEFLKDVITMSQGDPATVYRVDERFASMCDRLNLGATTPPGNGRRVAPRKDFIGLEIDRFFRLAGRGKPSLLGVGEQLMSRLPHSIGSSANAPEGVDVRVLEIPQAWDDGELPGSFRKYTIKEIVPSQSMKGISADYSVYHLFGAASLGDDIYTSPAVVETLLSPTQAFLAEHGFFALNRNSLLQ